MKARCDVQRRQFSICFTTSCEHIVVDIQFNLKFEFRFSRCYFLLHKWTIGQHSSSSSHNFLSHNSGTIILITSDRLSVEKHESEEYDEVLCSYLHQ